MVVDHALALFLVVFAPVLGRWSWRRLDHALSQRRDDARLTAYSETMVAEWALAIGVLVLWISSNRLAEDLGLAVSSSMSFFIVTVTVVVFSIFLLAQARSNHTMTSESGANLRRQMESVEQLLPHSAGERSVFMALSVTAGFCEELLYRGFL
ncbi:MAG TPA: hypothetical protein VMT00_03370, partial [Thermoanaerobaculia bacterium]|nr:hypothetical protein [Thermoanaerobaculia bacterium]